MKLLSVLGFWSIDAIKDLSNDQKILLMKLEEFSWDQIEEMEILSEQAVALERILRYYMERILESKLKSVNVMKELK